MQRLNEKETTPGAYAQYTYTLGTRLTAMAGVRFDHSSIYGNFFTPRFHVKYSPVDAVSIRLSAGKGYRTVFRADGVQLSAGEWKGTSDCWKKPSGFRFKFSEFHFRVSGFYSKLSDFCWFSAFQQWLEAGGGLELWCEHSPSISRCFTRL